MAIVTSSLYLFQERQVGGHESRIGADIGHLCAGGGDADGDVVDRLWAAGRTRLKPILMTSLCTVLGLVPMAFGLGGEKTQAPLAISVIGGLTVSTILTLLLVPTVYTVFEERFKRKLASNNKSEERQ